MQGDNTICDVFSIAAIAKSEKATHVWLDIGNFGGKAIMLGFVDAPLNRAANMRDDQTWLDAKWADPSSKALIFVDDRPAIVVSDGLLSIFYVSGEQAEKMVSKTTAVLLHLDDAGFGVFAINLREKDQHQIAAANVKFIDLRSLAMQAVLSPQNLGTLACARSFLHWHQNHQYCASCGQKTKSQKAGSSRRCDACQREHFPRVDPVVIMLVQHGDDFLMGRGHKFTENRYSALAGFLEPGETIEAAVRRETHEETGIEVGKVEYLMSQPWPFPSTLMIGVLAQALTREIILDTKELEEARWFSSSEIKQMFKEKGPDAITLPPPMSIAYQMLNQLIF